MLEFATRWLQSEHDRCRQDLSAYIDGNLSPREAARVEKHLAACTTCRAELDQLRGMVGMLRDMPAVPLPRSFLLPVSTAYQPRLTPKKSWAYVSLQGVTVVATVLLLVVVSADLWLRAPINRYSLPAEQPIAPTFFETVADDGRKAAPTIVAADTAGPAPLAAPEPAPQLGSPNPETAGAASENAAAALMQPGASPSVTLGRAASAPPRVLDGVPATPPPSTEPPQDAAPAADGWPTPLPTATVSPTPTPSAASLTPLVPAFMEPAGVATPELSGGDEATDWDQEGYPSSGFRAFLDAVGPFFPWLEDILATTAAALWAIVFWQRRAHSKA